MYKVYSLIFPSWGPKFGVPLGAKLSVPSGAQTIWQTSGERGGQIVGRQFVGGPPSPSNRWGPLRL